MKNRWVWCAVLCAAGWCAGPAVANPVVSKLVREAVEQAARRSGREVTEGAVREAAEKTMTRQVAKFGDEAARAAADGGLELIEATARHGDDVMKTAVKLSPAARRVLALNADQILPLVRRVGPEAAELAAKAPGLADDVFRVFGDDAGRVIARNIPAEDIPRLLSYAQRADSTATRKLLLEKYSKEGPKLFERIKPAQIVAVGLTATMLYGTKRVGDALDKAVEQNPGMVESVVRHGVTVTGILFGILTLLLLARFRLLPWRRTATASRVASVSAGSGSSPDITGCPDSGTGCRSLLKWLRKSGKRQPKTVIKN